MKNFTNAIFFRLFLLLLPVLVLPAPAAAYVYFFTYTTDIGTADGFRQHWNSTDFPIIYAINQNGCSDIFSFSLVEGAINQSFLTWQSTSSAKVSFQYGGTTAVDQVSVGDNNVNLVIFDTYTNGFTISVNGGGPSVVGLTINTYSITNGRISDSDIIFNDQQYVFTTSQATDLASKRINLQDVATHEIGHLLGLDHTWIEDATMYPYTRDGQNTLAPDDRAGISNLYPAATFRTSYDSLTGTVYNVDGGTVMGVYVSAISDSTGQEEVAALTDTLGYFNIQGLRHNSRYYLRAHTVDLKHVGKFYQYNSDTTVYIPRYYPGVSSKAAATAITTGSFSPDYDFTLSAAMLLARYDMSKAETTVLNFGSNTTSNDYLAVVFPTSSLPEAFKVHGLTFFNNDLNMAWPRIMLASGSETQPDINNPIRQVSNYEGAETSASNVEWEPVQLTSSRPLWVVFQFPDKPFVAVGDGPGLGAAAPGKYTDMYSSTNGGASFGLSPYDSQYDLKAYLTVEITDVALVPEVEFDVTSIDFGKAKVGRYTYKAYPIHNSGTSTLELFNMYSSSLAYTVAADNVHIEPDVFDTLRVGFKPFSTATWNGTLTIETNDQVRPSISISVTGIGVNPQVQLAATALAFDSVNVGEADSLGLWIRSTGEVALLAWGWATGDGNFIAPPAADTLEIPAGDSIAVTVRFAPIEGGSHNAALTFTTDDSAHTVHQVALSGIAVGDGVAMRCDMTGDGRANIIDVLYFLLLARRDPSDPRLDWNGDGSYSIADIVFMLKAIRNGTCPDIVSGAALAASDTPPGDSWLATLEADDIAWLREHVDQAGFTLKERERAHALLNGAGGGRSVLPDRFSLEQNHPNPFNPSTSISFNVPADGGGSEVSLKVYSISGRLVSTLAGGFRTPGVHTVFWDGTDQSGRRVASGVYIYRLQAVGQAWTRKMVLLK